MIFRISGEKRPEDTSERTWGPPVSDTGALLVGESLFTQEGGLAEGRNCTRGLVLVLVDRSWGVVFEGSDVVLLKVP